MLKRIIRLLLIALVLVAIYFGAAIVFVGIWLKLIAGALVLLFILAAVTLLTPRLLTNMKAHLTLLTATLCLSLGGCTLTPETKAKWSATGSLAASKAFAVGASVAAGLLAQAVSPQDESKKTDWLHSAAFGLRTGMADILSGEDIHNVLKIWVPDKPHWEVAVDGLVKGYEAELAQKQAPTLKDKEAAVEHLAEGVQVVASKTK